MSHGRFQITWAAALFGLTVGVLMTYVPYEFQAPVFRRIYPHIRLMGGTFLIGSVLLGVNALYPSWPRPVDWLGRLSFLAALSTYWWSASIMQGVTSGAVIYPVMMLGVLLEGSRSLRKRGLFAAFVTVVGLAFGALMLFSSRSFGGALYAAVRPILAPLGGMFLVAGVGLTMSRTLAIRRALFAVLAGGFAIIALTLAYANSWSGVALYAVLAPSCVAAGWLPELPRLTSVRWRLLRGMVVAGVLPLLALGAFASTAAHDALEREVWAHVRMAADDEAEWLREQLEDEQRTIHEGNSPRERLMRSRAPSSSYRVLVIDAGAGKLMQDTRAVGVGGPVLLSPELSAAVEQVGRAERVVLESVMIEAFDAEDKRVLAAVARVPGVRWVVVVTADVGETYAPITRLSAAVVLFLVLVVTLVLILSGFVARSVTRPLYRLRTAALELAGGDLDRRVSVSGPDEIADLNRAFNDMAERIAQAQRDLSELKDAIATRLADAQEANRLKDEFLSVVSHELRTPLNAILGWARILRTGAMPDASRAKALETIERNASLQAKLVEDLLDASRIVSGKLQLELGQVDLARVIQAAVDSVALAAQAKGIALEVDAPGPALVRGDAGRLQQVVWNLLANAIKFTPREGQVTVRLESGEADTFRVIVSDSGQGIEEDFLPHVFERFRQADATVTRKHGGLGLGLAIVRQLVEAHGGTVQAESAGGGQGATFTVELPRAGGRVERPSLVDPVEEMPSLAGMRVLVVDDEVDAAELVQSVLATAGAQVRVAHSAEGALEVLSAWKPDLLISDIGMPDVDGYTLMRQVRAMSREAGGAVPAIALTAFAQEEDRVRALSAGYQLHVTKPVDPRALAVAVSNLSRSSGALPQAAAGAR
ncbi:hybrid sensor histidine kinase/response regulator [Chondromyces crocatus]|uniref:histidine kinase n=1 Tax=Chondromyces crocatus TaxID=52 RepID=A0A0K1ESV5_CHOCO|nr:ATP-binding protein [Chondromyces crocatus]AKT43946.1 uncharacterized protein CMC5_081830 [Chondromyces crocatus]